MTQQRTEAETGPSQEPGGGTAGEEPGAGRSPGAGSVLASVAGDLRELLEAGRDLLQLKAEALGLRVRSGVRTLLVGLVVALVAGAALVYAGVLLVSGLAGALSGLLGARWAGELFTGLLVLLLVGGGGRLLLRAKASQDLARLQRRYGSPETDTQQESPE